MCWNLNAKCCCLNAKPQHFQFHETSFGIENAQKWSLYGQNWSLKSQNKRLLEHQKEKRFKHHKVA